MIYCCPQSEWFLLGGDGRRIAPLKGELPLFGRANCNSPLQCATTPLEGIFHLVIVPYLVLGSLIRPIWRGLLESFGRCH